MKVEAKIQRWGNGLALRVAGLMRDIPHFKAGTRVDVEIQEDGFTVRKHQSTAHKLPYSEEELLADITPLQSELLANLSAKELGEDT